MPRFSSEGIEVKRIAWSQLAWWFILLFCINFLFSVSWSGDNWKSTVRSDGMGYYAYLPAVFVQHDLQYNFGEEMYCRYQGVCGTGLGRAYCNRIDSAYVNKYFAGEAVALTPFYLPAYGLSDWLGYEHDGYSLLYQCSVNVGGLFYLMLGLWCLRRLMKRFGIREAAQAIVLLTLFFGTNLLYYTLIEGSMSHVFSFGFISAFLLTGHRLFEKFTRGKLLLFAFLFGMIVLIRPVNGIIILALPFLAGSWNELKKLFVALWQNKAASVLALLVFAAVLFIQFLLYYLQCGKWFVYAYTNEKLIWSEPHFFDFLFSWRKGLFVYTPVLLLMLAGAFALRKERFRMFAFLGLFLLVSYVLSCWWMWFYGGSYGMRAFIEYFPLFAVPFGLLLQQLRDAGKARLRWFVVLLLLPLTYVNLVQTWQAKQTILPYDKITKEKYQHIFLETGPQFRFIYPPDGYHWFRSPSENTYRSWKNDFEGGAPWPFSEGIVAAPPEVSGSKVARLDAKFKSSPVFSDTLRRLIPDSLVPGTSLRVTARVWLDDNSSDAEFIVQQYTPGNNPDTYGWSTGYLIHRTAEEKNWVTISFDAPLQMPRTPADLLNVYISKHDNKLLYIDDMEIRLLR